MATSVAEASIGDGVTIVAGDALSLDATNNMDATAIADGSAAEGALETAIGVAVSINLATARTEANIGAGALVTSVGSTQSAGMKEVDTDTTHRFAAKATSGASGTDTGIAGSFALNISDTISEAAIKTGATLNAGAGDVSRRNRATHNDSWVGTLVVWGCSFIEGVSDRSLEYDA